jgi:hypothetical protein
VSRQKALISGKCLTSPSSLACELIDAFQRWEFAMANDVVLPDEYDRIHLDLAPFFALPRDEMHKRVEQVQNLPETYTLRIRRGKVTIDVSYGSKSCGPALS